MGAPRAFACSSVSRTRHPEPSPITNPSRFLSKGREALSGSSFIEVTMARMAAKPANDSGVIDASVPPAIITSACPDCSRYSASPMAWVPLAHAEVHPKFGPSAPISSPTMPDAVLATSDGIIALEIASSPLLPPPLLKNLFTESSKKSTAPVPEPTITPILVLSTLVTSSLASLMAILEAATPKCAKRPQVRAVLASIHSSGPFHPLASDTTDPTRHGYSSHHEGILAIPDLPSTSA
mmetsp:Transcript_47249/g.94714  ORF Transcript_47249/g.94714 Transcript_47249/m.94714 type:complete len:238 (+) Transcript_47249:410-1123(+)